jgi:RNA polymerase sigma factor FliA
MIVVEADERTIEQAEIDKLVMEQMPHVKYIAGQIHEQMPSHVLLEDLLHAGIVGLIDAARKYDPGKNVLFATYAQFRIRGAILDSLRNNDWGPRHLRRKARRMNEMRLQLHGQLGREPGESELAEAMDMKLEDFQSMLCMLRGLEVGSLQVESTIDGSELNLAESLPGPSDQDPLTQCLRGERRQLLADAIAQLPERQRQLITLYYGQDLKMKKAGDALGVTQGRASQIHSAAVSQLREILNRTIGSGSLNGSGRGKRPGKVGAEKITPHHSVSRINDSVGVA